MKRLTRTTKDLVVRPLERRDYAAWKEAFSTMLPPRNDFDHGNRPARELTRGRFNATLVRQKRLRADDRFYSLSVFERGSGRLVGTVSIMDLVRSVSQSAFLGYAIGNRYWGRGYGKQATRAAIDIAFRDLKLHRIEAGVQPKNRRSILLARALGLRKEGLKKRAVFLNGAWRDLVVYGATCDELGIAFKGVAKHRRI
jgi:[ribosomal protein S5]-alanine N-acetyltransferase